MKTRLTKDNRFRYMLIAAMILLVGFRLLVKSPQSTPYISGEYSSGLATMPARFHPSEHFLNRLNERGVSVDQAVDVMDNGRLFYDPKNDSYIHWKDGIYVAVAPDGVLKTVIRGPLEPRWQPR